MSIVQVDTDIELFVKEGSDLVLRADAEEQVVRLMDLIDLLNETMETIKGNITSSALQAYPDFKGVVGEHIKAIYRAYGDRYVISNPDEAGEFIRPSITYRADVARIDEYVKKHGELPRGVVENERIPKLSISRIK